MLPPGPRTGAACSVQSAEWRAQRAKSAETVAVCRNDRCAGRVAAQAGAADLRSANARRLLSRSARLLGTRPFFAARSSSLQASRTTDAAPSVLAPMAVRAFLTA